MKSSVVAVAASTVASRVTGFGRVFALAYALSFTRLSDSYNLANTTPNIVYTLVLGGVLATTLVPVFVELFATENEHDAWRGVSAVVTLAMVVLVAVTVVFAVAAPAIIRIYTFRLSGAAASDQRAVAGTLLRLFAPQIAFYGVVTLATAVLNARRRFVAPMVTPVLNNLVVIGVLLALPSVARSLSIGSIRDDPAALLLLGLGTTAGVAVQAFALLPSFRRAGVRLRPVWAPRHPAVRQVVRLSGWIIGYVAANQVALWVVLALANERPGDVSAYQAAYMFFQLPYAVVAVTVITVLNPEMAEGWTLGDVDGFRRTLGRGARLIVFLMLPAALGFVAFGGSLVTLALRHGALTAAAATTTGQTVVAMALGLPAFALFLWLMSAYQAMQNTKTAFFMSCVQNLANIVLALALYPTFGVRGLAFAYALAYVVGAAVSLVELRRRLGAPLGVAQPFLRMTVAAAISATAIVVVALALAATPLPSSAGRLTAVLVGAAVYGATAWLLRLEELGASVGVVRRVRARPPAGLDGQPR